MAWDRAQASEQKPSGFCQDFSEKAAVCTALPAKAVTYSRSSLQIEVLQAKEASCSYSFRPKNKVWFNSDKKIDSGVFIQAYHVTFWGMLYSTKILSEDTSILPP